MSDTGKRRHLACGAAIVIRLGEAEPDTGVSVGELAEPFDVSLPAISRHLRVLERAGMLTQERDGRVRRCRLDAAPIREAGEWLAVHRRFWDRQLDAMVGFLEAAAGDDEAFGMDGHGPGE